MSKIKGAENAQELPFSIMILCGTGTIVHIKYANCVYIHRIKDAAGIIEFIGRINEAAGKTIVVTEINTFQAAAFNGYTFSGEITTGLELICK